MTGYWRTDDDDHDYLIPGELINQHDELATKMEEAWDNDTIDEIYEDYESQFGHYRINRFELRNTLITIGEDSD